MDQYITANSLIISRWISRLNFLEKMFPSFQCYKYAIENARYRHLSTRAPVRQARLVLLGKVRPTPPSSLPALRFPAVEPVKRDAGKQSAGGYVRKPRAPTIANRHGNKNTPLDQTKPPGLRTRRKGDLQLSLKNIHAVYRETRSV